MYSRWISPHVRRLFCFYSSTLSSGGALVSARLCRLPEQEVHHPSRNVNYRKEIGALDSFVGHLTALLVHLRQVHPLKAPSAVRSDSLKRN